LARWRAVVGRKSCVSWYTSAGTISSRGSDLVIAPLTPLSDTLRRPTCLRTQPELLHTLAPLAVSTSRAEMSPFTSVCRLASSLARSFTRTSVLGSE
jgi:hypothetical protein